MKSRGFTLIEMLVAVAITLALSGAVLAYIWRLRDAQERMTVAAARSAGVEMLFTRLEDDLVGVIAGDPKLGAGVKGDATSLTLLCRGTPPLSETNRGGDLVRMELRFDALTGTVYGERSGAEKATSASDAAEAVFGADVEATPRGEALIEGVREMRLRYYTQGAWSESFDSGASGGLPEAVEVALWFGAVDEASEGVVAETDMPRPPPDRLRVIVVPDAPEKAWGGGL